MIRKKKKKNEKNKTTIIVKASGGMFSAMVNVIRNETGKPSSNPKQGC